MVSRKRRVHKGKLLLVVVVILSIVFGVSKIFSFVSGKKEKIQPTTTRSQNVDSSKIINVAIDAAKGGDDKGVSLSNGQYEKDINFEIANRISQRLSQEADVNPLLVRESDVSTGTQDRVKNIKKMNADIVISIRLNASKAHPDAEGIESYYMDKVASNMTDTKNKTDKSLENNASNTENVKNDIKNVKSDTKTVKSSAGNVEDKEKNSTLSLSKELADSIQKMTISYVSMTDRGSKEHSFDILSYMNRPSVIVQPGFITNLKDSQILGDSEKLDSLSSGISEGILQFIDKNKNEIISNRVEYK